MEGEVLHWVLFYAGRQNLDIGEDSFSLVI